VTHVVYASYDSVL